MPATLDSTLATLASLGRDSVRSLNHRAGAGDNQYGVALGDIRMVSSIAFVQVADWFSAYLARKHSHKEILRTRWMTATNPWAARAGWDLTAKRIGKQPEGLELPRLLDRIETELGSAHSAPQWTMNNCLAGIGIYFPELRARALAIGEKLGVYRTYPVSKGCTSPFAPVWIGEMVRRKG